MGKSDNNIIQLWQAKHDKDTQRNLAEFILFAQSELTLYKEQGWDAPSWKPTKGQTIVFGFRQTEGNSYSPIDTFKGPYLEFVKAFIRQQMTLKEITSAHLWISMFRNLYLALVAQEADKAPCIRDVTGQTLKDAVAIIKQSESNLTRRYQIGGKLTILVKWLLNERIVLTLPTFKNPFPKPADKAEQLGEEADKFREERCPTMHEMLSFAECFARAKTVQDKYYTSALVLLCFAPGRINELDGLTIHSLQQGDDGGWYIVWHGSKSYPDHRKPVPLLMLDVVKKAFNRLISIGKPARECAKWAYEHPHEFYKHEGCITPPSHKDNQSLSHSQIAHAMSIVGFLNNNGVNFQHSKALTNWLKALLDEETVTYSRLNEIVHQKYKNKSWPNNPDSKRPVWENLLLYRDLELKPKSATKQFSWTMPTINSFNEQLSKKPKLMSTLWERFNMTQEDGTPIALTTHQFRVWLNTHAKIGGVDDWKIAQWSGRADYRQNSAYDLRTLEQKRRLSTELMLASYDETPSAVILRKYNLPVTLKSVGIDREGITDFTGIGFCTHNFAQTPCTKAGECVTCKDHVCLTGIPETLKELEQMEKLISEQLDKAIQANGKDVFGADRWVTHHGWKLGHIRTLIAIMKDESLPEGTIVKIPVEHDPSPTRRALEDKKMVTDLEEHCNSKAKHKPLLNANINKLLGFG
ncbi:hypothetical protein [Shewanella xiamenensis]|uniref:hypothetical protein n=1 Tax=Shewanella xiamenensis TaxID=332186 RepID=UPI0021C1F771|nr:hypothetical protein [Shewanella xiamenensis]MCT8869576.1 hypothetical protein [Shewanella xiamenensis]